MFLFESRAEHRRSNHIRHHTRAERRGPCRHLVCVLAQLACAYGCSSTQGAPPTGGASGLSDTGRAEGSAPEAVAPNAAAPEAVAPNAAAPEAPVATAADPCANALLCDDFDSLVVGSKPGAPWSVSENNGSVLISSERAFSGANSVHCTGNSGRFAQAYFSIQGAPLFPAAGAAMYGRMMLWVRDNPQGSIHWTFVSAEGRSSTDDYTAFYRVGGQVDGRLLANYWTEGNATDCWDHSTTVMPVGDAGGWTCLEWHYQTATDELEFWLNGRALTDLHIVSKGEGCIAHDLADVWEAPAAFDVLRLGWEHVATTDQREIWIDDVAVGTTRQGCPAPR